MVEKDKQALDRQFERIERKVPDRVSRFIRWIRRPGSRWVRIPLGLLLMAGGVFGFLPALGLWMLPFGLLLLAQDLPFLRRPMRWALIRIERRWNRWQRARRKRGN